MRPASPNDLKKDLDELRDLLKHHPDRCRQIPCLECSYRWAWGTVTSKTSEHQGQGSGRGTPGDPTGNLAFQKEQAQATLRAAAKQVRIARNALTAADKGMGKALAGGARKRFEVEPATPGAQRPACNTCGLQEVYGGNECFRCYRYRWRTGKARPGVGKTAIMEARQAQDRRWNGEGDPFAEAIPQ